MLQSVACVGRSSTLITRLFIHFGAKDFTHREWDSRKGVKNEREAVLLLLLCCVSWLWRVIIHTVNSRAWKWKMGPFIFVHGRQWCGDCGTQAMLSQLASVCLILALTSHKVCGLRSVQSSSKQTRTLSRTQIVSSCDAAAHLLLCDPPEG